MKLSDINNIHIWRSDEEQKVLDRIVEPLAIESVDERTQSLIETLIRKNLLTKVKGKNATYVYPTTE